MRLPFQFDTDTFEVNAESMEGVSFRVNHVSLELTADQAEAFGLALVLTAHRSRALAAQEGF